MSKKPTGTIGPLKIQVTSNGDAIKIHEKVIWPSNQKEIEDIISDLFIEEWRKIGVETVKKSGGTEDLDYLLTVNNTNKSYLELMEAVIPQKGEIPFNSAAQRHEPLEYANQLYKTIQKKTDLYGFKHTWPIDLLIYVTHEQYKPNDATFLILTKYLQERRHSFRYVFFLMHSGAHTELRVLYNPDSMQDIPPIEELAKHWWLSLPMSGFELFVQKNDPNEDK